MPILLEAPMIEMAMSPQPSGECRFILLPADPQGGSRMGMFARYLKYSRQTIVRAKHEADRFGSPEIDPEHILLALLNDANLINRTMQGISEKEIVTAIEAHIPQGERNPLPHDLDLSKTGREALLSAEGEADKLGHRDIRNEHILLGLVESKNSFVAKLLAEKGVCADHIRRQILSSS